MVKTIKFLNFSFMKIILAIMALTFSTVSVLASEAPVENKGAGGYVEGVCYPWVTLNVFYSGNFTMLDAIANQNTCKAKK